MKELRFIGRVWKEKAEPDAEGEMRGSLTLVAETAGQEKTFHFKTFEEMVSFLKKAYHQAES